MNELEFQIEKALAEKYAAENGYEQNRPGCPAVTDLLAVASNQADADVVKKVEEHRKKCDLCDARLSAMNASIRQGEVKDLSTDLGMSAEPGLGGSALSRAASKRHSEVGWTGIGGTRLGRSDVPSDRAQLVTMLRVWLPCLIQELNLPAFDAEKFLADVLSRPPLSETQRFRDELPKWLAEATGRAAESIVITQALVARGAVLVVASRAETGESPLATNVRQFVQEQQPKSPDELLTMVFPERLTADPAFRPYVRDLHREARLEYRKGLELFELPTAA